MASIDELRLPNEDDPELVGLVDRFVMPGRRYLELLHANFVRLPEQERSNFVHNLRSDAATITDSELTVLLSSEWRSRLCASWMIAAEPRAAFAKRLGDLLLASELTYQGQGFCAALAATGDATSVDCLRAYLDHWLSQIDCRYDQTWAMAALIVIDERLGTSNAQPFLAPGGAWESWRSERTDLDRQTQALRSGLEMICG